MKNRKLSPKQISGIAFLVVFLGAACLLAVIMLAAPADPDAEQDTLAGIYNTVSTAACPVAIIVGVLAYYWAKGNQDGLD